MQLDGKHLLLALALLVAGCDREKREVRLDPPVLAALDQVALMQNGIGGASPPVYVALERPYESNAYNLSEGKRLYGWFGCKGCHGDGGEGRLQHPGVRDHPGV